MVAYAIAALFFAAACSGVGADAEKSLLPPPAAAVDAGEPADAAGAGGARDGAALPADGKDAAASDAASSAACSVSGAPGECMTLPACAALSDHTSFAGHCPGPAAIECCIQTPSTADNPPIPAGYKLMVQADVTPEMTAWAVAILNAPATYPMFSTTTRTFGTLLVLARVEWHPPDFQNGVVHRGVTLYEPL
jgi:hypothetical protein